MGWPDANENPKPRGNAISDTTKPEKLLASVCSMKDFIPLLLLSVVSDSQYNIQSATTSIWPVTILATGHLGIKDLSLAI